MEIALCRLIDYASAEALIVTSHLMLAGPVLCIFRLFYSLSITFKQLEEREDQLSLTLVI